LDLFLALINLEPVQEIKKNWFKKAAEEAELIVTSESEDENFANPAQKVATSKVAIQVRLFVG
jgi:hypothetical protein